MRPRIVLLSCLLLLAGCDQSAGRLRVTGVSTTTPSIGGALVVHGAGFTDAEPLSVTIGGAPVPDAFIGSVTYGQLELTVPAGTPSGSLVLTDARGESATYREELHVIASLEIDPLEALPDTRLYQVTVRARDVDGRPVPGAQLLLEASGGAFDPGPYVITDVQGEASATLDLTGVDVFVEVKVRAPPLYAAAYLTDQAGYPHGAEVMLSDDTTSMPVYLALAEDGSVTVSTLNRRPAGPPDPEGALPGPEPRSLRAGPETGARLAGPEPTEVIVAYRSDLAPSSLARADALAALGLERVMSAGGLDLVRLPAGLGLEEALARLNADPRVDYAEPNYRLHLAGSLPSDPELYRQWGLFAVGAPSAWTVSVGTGVVVAVIDTAIDASHPDLAGALLPGYDFCADNDDCTTFDDDPSAATPGAEHGTHVAGIIAASPDNGYGTVGVAPGARVLPVKVFSEADGSTASTMNVALAIRWAAGLNVNGVPANPNPARVINLSLGGDDNSQTVANAVAAAVDAGVVVVAATGNQGRDGVLYPAALPDVIGVGAIEEDWDWAGYSNYGDGVDLVAPGTLVLSSKPGGGVRYEDGTSMSTPHVSAVAALVLSHEPDLTPAEVAEVLESTAYRPVGSTTQRYGAGVVRADGALGLPAPTTEADRYASVTVAGNVTGLDLREGFSDAVALDPEDVTPPVDVVLEHGGLELSGTLESW